MLHDRIAITSLVEIDKQAGRAHIARRRIGMMFRLLLALGLSLAISGCGIKSDLLMPNGKPTPKSQRDPSRPPQPIGR